MRKVLVLIAVLVMATCATIACKQGAQNPDAPAQSVTPAQSSVPAASAPAGDDAMTAELAKLAGSGSTDCGRVAHGGDLAGATDCAMKANDAKKPFYVRYDLPLEDGTFSIATVRGGDGKLTTVQYDTRGFQQAPEKGSLSADKKIVSQPCDLKNPLRVASSGRVTCFPPSTGGAMAGGASPHGMGGMMGGATGTNPHGDMKMPPAPMGGATKSH